MKKILLMISALSLLFVSCSKEGPARFEGNWSYKTSGTVTLVPTSGSSSEQVTATIVNESGQMNVTFILNGWTKGSWLDLEKIKEQIADSLRSVVITVDGYGVGIFYGNATPIPEEDAELKRIQITLDVRVWRNK